MAAKAGVIDTNVGIAANSQADVSGECELECIRLLREVTEGRPLVLDRNGLIFGEYLRYLSLSGEPGVGDAFMQWVNDNQYNEERCTLVPLTIAPDGEIDEFPKHDGLKTFDPSDEKFVAVAASHSSKAPVHVAVDRGWVRHRDALSSVQVEVVFLCPNDIGLPDD